MLLLASHHDLDKVSFSTSLQSVSGLLACELPEILLSPLCILPLSDGNTDICYNVHISVDFGNLNSGLPVQSEGFVQ